MYYAQHVAQHVEIFYFRPTRVTRAKNIRDFLICCAMRPFLYDISVTLFRNTFLQVSIIVRIIVKDNSFHSVSILKIKFQDTKIQVNSPRTYHYAIILNEYGINEPRYENTAFCICKNKDADQLVSAFLFPTWIVQSLFFLNQRFLVSSHIQ